MYCNDYFHCGIYSFRIVFYMADPSIRFSQKCCVSACQTWFCTVQYQLFIYRDQYFFISNVYCFFEWKGVRNYFIFKNLCFSGCIPFTASDCSGTGRHMDGSSNRRGVGFPCIPVLFGDTSKNLSLLQRDWLRRNTPTISQKAIQYHQSNSPRHH